MNSYSQSYPFYAPSSPSLSCIYSNYNMPSTPYCTCCLSPTSYYQQQQQISPSLIFTPPPSPFIPLNTQISTSSSTTQRIQPSSAKVTRLQYSNKDRYILNELFKRTPYPNGIQRDVIARQLSISQEQIRIWFQNRRRLQTQRDTGEKLATSNELMALQQGQTYVNSNELKKLFNQVAKYKDAPPRLRLDESS